MIPAWLLLMVMFKPEIKHLSRTKEELKAEFRAMGRMSKDEIVTAVIFFITVAVWLTSDYISPLIGVNIVPAIPAFLCCGLFFLPGLTTFKWKEVSNDIAWEGVILIATGVSIGMTMFNTGAAHWMAERFLGGLMDLHPLLQIFLVVAIVQLIKVMLSSNTVTATIIIPVMIVMVQSRPEIPYMGLGIILPTAISLSLAFILVTSTPTNVIPYSTGYFTMSDFAKAGAIMTVISSLIMALTMFAIGSLSGLY
jgi:sodium-dependent dicarboxylate transporter 2/3/5